eukprot:6183988-Pleurochrysis_carterae.AAC.2
MARYSANAYAMHTINTIACILFESCGRAITSGWRLLVWIYGGRYRTVSLAKQRHVAHTQSIARLCHGPRAAAWRERLSARTCEE